MNFNDLLLCFFILVRPLSWLINSTFALSHAFCEAFLEFLGLPLRKDSTCCCRACSKRSRASFSSCSGGTMVSSVVNLCPFPHSLLLLYLTGVALVSMTVDHAPHSGQFIVYAPPCTCAARLRFLLKRADCIWCIYTPAPAQRLFFPAHAVCQKMF